MKVEFQQDEALAEPKILVCAPAFNEEVQETIQRLTEAVNAKPSFLIGGKEGKVEILDPDAIFRIYAAAGKVLAQTLTGEYTLRSRLYEVEEKLDARKFVRISNSEIVNFTKVAHFDLSLTGTILVKLKNGTTTYVSRRYVSRIKGLLGL